MAELLRLKPLFRGKGSIEQLNKIIHILGTPSEQELKELCFKGMLRNVFSFSSEYVC